MQVDLRQRNGASGGGSADPNLLIQQIELRHLRHVSSSVGQGKLS